MKGKEISYIVKSVMPEGKFTKEALRIHRLTKEVLKKKGAKVFSKVTSE